MKQLYKLTRMLPVYVYVTEEQIKELAGNNSKYELQDYIQDNYPRHWCDDSEEMYTLTKADMTEDDVLLLLQDKIPNL
jgi:hypothetical protein